MSSRGREEYTYMYQPVNTSVLNILYIFLSLRHNSQLRFKNTGGMLRWQTALLAASVGLSWRGERIAAKVPHKLPECPTSCQRASQATKVPHKLQQWLTSCLSADGTKTTIKLPVKSQSKVCTVVHCICTVRWDFKIKAGSNVQKCTSTYKIRVI